MSIKTLKQNLYTTKAHTVCGHEGGALRTGDADLEVKITPPCRGDGMNREQLVALRWSTALFKRICRVGMVGFVAFNMLGCGTTAKPQAAAMDQDFSRAMMESMAKMDRDMMAAPMTGDPDHDFAAMMIPHHQGAIDMAEPYLLQAKDPVLRRLAQEIIVTQQQEIEVMRKRLAALQNGTAGAALPNTQDSKAPLPVSSHDRVYTGDQTSNTVSVIDPGSNKLLGIILAMPQNSFKLGKVINDERWVR